MKTAVALVPSEQHCSRSHTKSPSRLIEASSSVTRRYISLTITVISQLNLPRDKLLHTVYECGDCWEASTLHLFSLWFLNVILSQSFLSALCLSVAAKCKYASSADGPLLSPLPCLSDEVKTYPGFWLLQRPDHHKTPKKQTQQAGISCLFVASHFITQEACFCNLGHLSK